jgi:beta-galactosidase
MKSRSFARWLTTVLVCLVTHVAFARETVSLDQGWKFIKEDARGASEVSFDDSSWTGVDLPHTWNATDAAGGSNKSYYRGPGWYRKHVTISAEQAGKSIYVWFGACGSAAEVFVNGKSAGTHKGAFQAFCFDVTPLVKAGDNVIAVRGTNAVDNSIAPLSGDFNVCGGLYRDAKLLVLDKVHISPIDFGSPGVYVHQRGSNDAIELHVTAMLRNRNDQLTGAQVNYSLLDRDGKVIAATVKDELLAASSDSASNFAVVIKNPHLWQARKDPYLYNLKVEVLDAGTKSDELTIPIGLRTFSVDPRRGFILNGEHYDVHGVNRHQDREGKAWAITHEDMEQDIELLKELGVTGIRCAHYQHSPYFYELCDKAGIVVWAELCMVNKIDPSKEFHDVTKQQLTELIKQNYNRPSICFWSLYNELNWNSKEAGVVDAEIAFVKELSELAHQLDDSRPTTGATHKATEFPGNVVTDIVSFNRYYGWYSGTEKEWGDQLDKMRQIIPQDKPIGISEYGAGASIKQHEIKTVRPRTAGRWHPEEWQATVHEAAWRAMSKRPWMWDKFLWCFADFGSAGRTEGDRDGINDKGLLTYDRKIRKDAFYFYKANWNDEPMLHITSQRWTPRAEASAPIKIYSNCEKIELKVNGQSMGEKSPDEIHVAQWDGVNLKQGENKIEASGVTKEGKKLDDACTIVHDPAATTQPG